MLYSGGAVYANNGNHIILSEPASNFSFIYIELLNGNNVYASDIFKVKDGVEMRISSLHTGDIEAILTRNIFYTNGKTLSFESAGQIYINSNGYPTWTVDTSLTIGRVYGLL